MPRGEETAKSDADGRLAQSPTENKPQGKGTRRSILPPAAKTPAEYPAKEGATSGWQQSTPRSNRAENRYPGESQVGKRSSKRSSRKEAIAEVLGRENMPERKQNKVFYAGSTVQGNGSTRMANPVRMRRARQGCFPAQGDETLDSWHSLENSCGDRKRKTVPPKDESNKKRHRDVRNQLKVLSLFQPIPRPPRCLHFSLMGSGLLHPVSSPQ